jgi:hypothetical protein
VRNCFFRDSLCIQMQESNQSISLTYTRRYSGFPAYLFPYRVSYTNKKEKKTSVSLSSAPLSCCISTTTPIFPFSSLVLHPSPSFRITFRLTILCNVTYMRFFTAESNHAASHWFPSKCDKMYFDFDKYYVVLT